MSQRHNFIYSTCSLHHTLICESYLFWFLVSCDICNIYVLTAHGSDFYLVYLVIGVCSFRCLHNFNNTIYQLLLNSIYWYVRVILWWPIPGLDYSSCAFTSVWPSSSWSKYQIALSNHTMPSRSNAKTYISH